MVRPREFDETEVLDRALDAFWAKGFEGTSIHDLTEATGLARASLYGAFGDKQQLYERVVAHYIERAERSACPEPGAGRELSTHDQLLALFEAWMGLRCGRVAERGCFLALAGTGGGEPGFAKDLLAASMKRREKTLVKILRAGQERGDVDASRSATSLARLLVVVTQGISGAARTGWAPSLLDDTLREAVSLVAPRG